MSNTAPARRFNYIQGYHSTLVRADVKELLTDFRRRHGYSHAEHIERCLSSACIELCLADESLLGRLLEQLDEAVVRDARLARSAQVSS